MLIGHIAFYKVTTNHNGLLITTHNNLKRKLLSVSNLRFYNANNV